MKKKTIWNNRAVFAIPLEDGSYAYGQAVDLMMTNVVYCSFFNIRTDTLATQPPAINKENLISCVAVSREQLDYGAWPIVGTADLVCDRADFANEQYADDGYVGAEIYDAALAEEFVNSFYCLLPWDDWHDPNFLDELLVSPDKKPKNLVYKKGSNQV